MRRHLLPGELVLLSTRRHLLGSLAGASLRALALIGACAATGWYLTPATTTDPLDLGAGAVAGLVLTWWLSRVWRWSGRRFVLTDERIVETRGRIVRRLSSTPLVRINDVSIDWGIGGRLLGYGDLCVTLSDGSERRFERLPHPTRTYRVVLDAVLAPPEATGGPEFWHEPDEWSPVDETWMAADLDDTGPLGRVVV